MLRRIVLTTNFQRIADGRTDLGRAFHETMQGVLFTVSEYARRDLLQRPLKLNHERYVEEVQQGLHDKKKGGAGRVTVGGKKKKPTSKPKSTTPMLFDFE